MVISIMLCLIATLAWITGAPGEHVLIMYSVGLIGILCYLEGKWDAKGESER